MCSLLIVGVVPTVWLTESVNHNVRNATLVAGTTPPASYVVVILMENQGLSDIYQSSSAPYQTQLANSYSLATQYTAVSHPSLPNYMAITGGDTFQSWSVTDCDPGPGCNTTSTSIIDEMDSAGLSWKAYMEDATGPCPISNTSLYGAFYNPFLHYQKVLNNQARCDRIVPANPGHSGLPDNQLLSDLGSISTASNFIWLTPNLNDSASGEVSGATISMGDNYLSKLVPQILNSYIFTTQKAALVITYDEGNGSYPSDYVYTVWAGRVVKTNYQSSVQYSHYSLLRTLESIWGLSALTAFDAGSTPMLEFFTTSSTPSLTSSIIRNPASPTVGQSISFTGLATGGTPPYSYSWNFGDGSSANGPYVTHTYEAPHTFAVTETVKDSSSPEQTVSNSQIVTVSTGTCSSCVTLPQLPTSAWLLILGGLIGLLASLALVTAKAHLRLKKTKRRLEQQY